MKWRWLFVLVATVSADTIQLHDGKTVEGTIVGETESNLTIEVAIAGGTILQNQVIPKSTVTTFARWTPEQKRVVAMQRAYQTLAKTGPDPDTSASVVAYDKAIGELQNFLTTYPGSSYEQEVTDRLAQWQAERQKVAAGMVKVDGTWLTKEEREKRQLRDNIQTLMKQGNDAFAAKQWPQAVRAYDALLALRPSGVTEALANRQATEALTAWRVVLQPQLEQLEPELAAAQHRLERAQGSAKPAKANPSPGDGKLGVESSNRLRAQTELTAAESQLKKLRPQVEKMRAQLAEINRRLTPAAPAVAAASDGAPVSTDILQDTASWWDKYWMILAGVAVVGVWLVHRLMGR
ncbi:MAG: hypothetical protein WCS70_00690 [Verrucomicrobiota bacterium]